MKHEILSKTYSEYISLFERGKLLAGELYRQWFKKGKILLDTTASLRQAKALVGKIVEETDWELPKTVAMRSDGNTHKFLVATHDGYEVECVRIPMKTQETLCVSSQVGCRMGCTFCETGRMGLLRNLTAKEIVWQVFIARFVHHFDIRNIVFMGMGEPFDNFEEVRQAIRVLTDQNGMAFGMHRVTVSTSGKIDGILRLAEDREVSPNLAVSINAPHDALRSKLMPHNRKENLAQIKDACKTYNRLTGKQILMAYVLMKGVNDTLTHADELAQYVEGLDVKVNLIPYNSQAIDRYQTSDIQVVNDFAARLRREKLRVLIRGTKGDSIMAACGQLGNASRRKLVSIDN